MNAYVPLSFLDLTIAAALIAINGAISVYYGLRLEKSLAVAAVRMVVQLSAVALVLKFVFAQVSPLWTLLCAGIMAVAAILEIVMRQDNRFKGFLPLLATSSPAFVASLVTTLLALAVIAPNPWYAPRFLLPILGMLAGNALSGVALVLDALTSAARRERATIETRLAHGAPRLVAFDEPLKRALKAGLMPILNAMAVAGIVSLPGMMTGQILAGIDPAEAAKYQILIMFFIAGTSAIAVLAAALGAVYYLTDERHRLRLDYLEAPKRQK